MKERIVSGLKKVAVMLIASAMVLGLIPVGLLSLRSVTDNDEGRFIRLLPILETYVSAKTGESETPGSSLISGYLPAGRYHDSYIRFDIRELLESDIKDITGAKLRLTPISTENNTDTPVKLSIMENNTWNADIDYNSKPSSTHDINIAEIDIESSQCGETPLEIDLTEYIKKYIADKREYISLNVKGAESGTVSFAGTSYEDKAFRPCLKITTGTATDPDSSDLRKSVLDNAYKNPDGSTNLHFSLTPYNIQGAMYNVALSLNPPNDTEPSPITVYCEDVPVFNSESATYEDMQNINITHIVNDLYSRGATSINLSVSGINNIHTTGTNAPKLNISVSDNQNVVAVTEGLIYSLEQNISPSEIKDNLSENYTTESGTTAGFSWSAVYTETGLDASEILKPNGSVDRPAWFKDSCNISAIATATSGNYSCSRQYNLTVLPQDLPDYTNNKFSNYVNLGAAISENKHDVNYSGAEQHSDWISGKHFPYRSLEPEDILAFSLKADTENKNYLTLKLTAENINGSTLVIENLQNRSAEPIVIDPSDKFSENGFVYCTYPLPEEYSTENGFSTFRLTCTNNTEIPEDTAGSMAEAKTFEEVIPDSTASATGVPSDESVTEDSTREKLPVWNIHSAYMTQSPYFDPQDFADRGEILVEKTSLEDTDLSDLLRNLYRSVVPDDEIESIEEGTAASPTWTKPNDSTIAFADGENNVAVLLPPDNSPVQIHRSTIYYDSYSEVTPNIYENGNLTAINYDMYRILINNSSQYTNIPWEEQNLSGIYYDLVSNKYFAFLGDGMAADVSVLPAGETLQDGKNAGLNLSETMILSFLAEPLYFPDWRVSEVNGESVSRTKIVKELTINEITIKNVGTATETAKELQVICGVYERGMIVQLDRQTVSIIPGYTEYHVPVNNIPLKPGQVLKVFIEQIDQPPNEMTEKLVLS